MKELIHKQDVFGGNLIIFPYRLVKGRNILKTHGFKQCPNPLYLQRKSEYIHYNKTLGYWIYEKQN